MSHHTRIKGDDRADAISRPRRDASGLGRYPEDQLLAQDFARELEDGMKAGMG